MGALYMSDDNDTTAAQARQGKDIQGIPWDRLSITRENYKKLRLRDYKNHHQSIPNSGLLSGKDCTNSEKGSSFYMFRKNNRSIKPSIVHSQLRNLVWATSNHDVYLHAQCNKVIHCSSLTGRMNEVLDLYGHVSPSQNHKLLGRSSISYVTTLAVKDEMIVAGGFSGELICKRLERSGESFFCAHTTFVENTIINAVDIHRSSSGALHFMASSSDGGVRNFDMERYQLLQNFRYPWPVNHSSVRPDGKLVAIVGDDPDGLLVDSYNGETVGKLKGHLDYSFATAWHPNGVTFATGNQDKTCRVWDLRNISKSVAVLKGNFGAIRSMRFTSDGQYMAMAEQADFVHIYKTNTGYMKKQEIDIFGDISGISFSPDTESLFIGIFDRTYGSLMEYGRRARVLGSAL